MVIAAATTEVATRTMLVVTVSAHTKIGIRVNDMPGARMRATVTRKLTALMIEDTPSVMKVMMKACWPRLACWLRGG